MGDTRGVVHPLDSGGLPWHPRNWAVRRHMHLRNGQVQARRLAVVAWVVGCFPPLLASWAGVSV